MSAAQGSHSDYEPTAADTGIYAADALTPQEREAFERAMANDAATAEEAAGLQATAARLGEAVAEPPPTGLRERVMAEVDQTRQDPPGRSPSTTPTDVVPGEIVALARNRRPRFAVRILAAAAAVLGVLTLALGANVIGLRQDNQALTQTGAEVSRVLTAPDAQTVSGAVEGQVGRAAVVVSPSLGQAVFVTDALVGAPPGQTYQLWLVSADGSATSAGTFVPDDDGDTAVVLAGSTTTAAVAMTLEPSGGSEQPTTTPVLALPLA